MNAPGHIGFLEMLLGRWSFAREISEHGSMNGTAVFQPVSEGRAEYFEFGELALRNGGRLHAEQRYVYKMTDDGFAVYFHATGEIFQRAIFSEHENGEWRASASHICNQDVYDSEYCFGESGTFAVRHAVRGPKKDYVIRTVYRRD